MNGKLKNRMRLVLKYTLLCIVTLSISQCKTKKEDLKVTEYLDKNDSIKKVVEQKISKLFTDSLTVAEKIIVKNQEIVVVDFNRDSLLDAVAFLGVFNSLNDSFKRTVILYYQNDGQELRDKDGIAPDTYIYPQKDAIKNVKYEATVSIATEEIKPNTSGVLDKSRVQESSLELRNGSLSYSVVVGKDHYDINSNYQVSKERDYKFVATEDGLEYRDKPDGDVLGNIPYGTRVHITGKTGWKKTRYVNGRKVTGEWVEVEINRHTKEKAFMLDAYLSQEYQLTNSSLPNASNYELISVNEYKYNTAENGLVYRKQPEGKILGKFNYGDKVHIIGRTDIVKTIYDEEEIIVGEWVQVKIDGATPEKGFVFDGYLKQKEAIDYRLANLNAPVVFNSTYRKGIVLPGKHLVYNKELEEISSIQLDKVVEVTILEKSKHKRPQKKGEAYCNWANYLSVKLNGEDYILFGGIVLESMNLSLRLTNGSMVEFIQAKRYTMGSRDKVELTGCDDFSELYIKSKGQYNSIYHLPAKGEKNLGKKRFIHDKNVSEGLRKIKKNQDTINFIINKYANGKQQDYTLKVFQQNGWKYIETDNEHN